jgi:hypothetical protein
MLQLGYAFLANASTFVYGNVSGTWTSSGNPYIVIDNCTVPSGSSLTIQQGVEVRVGQGLTITANGPLVVNGTAAQPVLIHGLTTSNYWNSITFGIGVSCDFNYCNISEATNAIYDNYGGTANNYFFNCNFRNCVGNAIYGYFSMAYSYYQNTPTNYIGNCTFSNCQGNAISAQFNLPGNPNVPVMYVTNCIFSNITNTCFNGPNATWGVLVDLHITSCQFLSSSNGIVGSPLGAAQITACIFKNITGVAVWGDVGNSGKSSVANCMFASCAKAFSSTMGFDSTVENNIFYLCDTSVMRDGTSSSQNTSSDVSYNCFWNNGANFAGYPVMMGMAVYQNANGTSCDIANNIFQNPLFMDTNTFFLASNSPCIDAGDPAPIYRDSATTNSLGSITNDIGIYGGPTPYTPNQSQTVISTLTLSPVRYFGVVINPPTNGTYRVQYIPSLDGGTWYSLQDIVLTNNSPYTFIDYDSPINSIRFYRAVKLP